MPNTLYYKGTWTKTPWKETIKCSKIIWWGGWQRRDSVCRSRECNTSDIQAHRTLYNSMQVHSGLSQSPEHRECPRRYYLQANGFLCKPEHSPPFGNIPSSNMTRGATGLICHTRSCHWAAFTEIGSSWQTKLLFQLWIQFYGTLGLGALELWLHLLKSLVTQPVLVWCQGGYHLSICLREFYGDYSN